MLQAVGAAKQKTDLWSRFSTQREYDFVRAWHNCDHSSSAEYVCTRTVCRAQGGVPACVVALMFGGEETKGCHVMSLSLGAQQFVRSRAERVLMHLAPRHKLSGLPTGILCA